MINADKSRRVSVVWSDELHIFVCLEQGGDGYTDMTIGELEELNDELRRANSTEKTFDTAVLLLQKKRANSNSGVLKVMPEQSIGNYQNAYGLSSIQRCMPVVRSRKIRRNISILVFSFAAVYALVLAACSMDTNSHAICVDLHLGLGFFVWISLMVVIGIVMTAYNTYFHGLREPKRRKLEDETTNTVPLDLSEDVSGTGVHKLKGEDAENGEIARIRINSESLLQDCESLLQEVNESNGDHCLKDTFVEISVKEEEPRHNDTTGAPSSGPNELANAGFVKRRASKIEDYLTKQKSEIDEGKMFTTKNTKSTIGAVSNNAKETRSSGDAVDHFKEKPKQASKAKENEFLV